MNGYARIEEERNRQINEEHWRAEGDDAYTAGQLADAASSYAAEVPELWPWDKEFYKPTTRQRDVEKAGALWLAERDRLERAGDPTAAVAAENEARQLGVVLDWLASGRKKTSVLMEGTPDGRWVVIISQGDASTARVCPDLTEALAAVPEGVSRVETAVQPDPLPETLEIAAGTETFVFGPGFGAQAPQTTEQTNTQA